MYDPVPYPHFTITTRNPNDGQLKENQLFWYWYQPTSGQEIVKGSGTLDLTWYYESPEMAALMNGKTGTLLYTIDDGETWHVYSDTVDMTANFFDGTNYVATNLELNGSQIDFGESESDTLTLKIVVNEDPSLELYGYGLSYALS